MANKRRGYVDVELDKPRRLRYDLNALAELEDRLGVPLDQIADVRLTIKNFRIMIWAGLIHEDPELTEEQVGAMVDGSNFVEVQQKVAEALALSFGTADSEDASDANPTGQKRGTGERSKR